MTDFNYNLQELQTAMNLPRIKIPPEALNNDDSFNKWIESTDYAIVDNNILNIKFKSSCMITMRFNGFY